MERAQVRQAYDERAEAYAALLPDTRAETGLDLAMIDGFIDVVGRGGRVLDAGCGAGRIARHLSDRGLDVVGTDLSPGMIRMAAVEDPDLPVAVASTHQLPFAGNVFDGVMLWYSTIHAPAAEQARLLGEAARVLRPGGHLVIAFQAGSGVREVGAGGGPPTEIPLVRHLLDPTAMRDLLAAAGLEERAVLVRRAVGHERDDQCVLLARLADDPA